MIANVVLIAAFFVFYGLFQGIFRTAGKALASSFVADPLRASGIGWYNTTVGVTQLVASLIAGELWDHVGHVAVFYYGAAFAVIGAFALWLVIPATHDRRHAAKANLLLREGGLERYAVNADEIQAIEPALHGAYYGGFYAPSDATGDIHKFTRGLAAACARRGAQFVYDADVQRVSASSAGMRVQWKTTDGGDDSKQERLADAIVICAGTASRRLAAMLGDRVNIYPVKGYSITVHLDDPLTPCGG